MTDLRVGHYKGLGLDIEIDDVEGVVFDELAAILDVFTHQCGEDFFGFNDVFKLYLQKRA